MKLTKQQRLQLRDKYGGRCAYTGKPLTSDWQVDHVKSQFQHAYWYTGEEDYNDYKKRVHNTDNLVPTLRIVNHYKRSLDLEGFRRYMAGFHLRLAKLPKTTKIERTAKRKAYMQSVADAFGITVDKPFSGVFYFETIPRTSSK